MPKGNRQQNLKVVIDTNVFVSALHFGGTPRKVVDLMWKKAIEVYISPFIEEEIERVLVSRFEWDKHMVDQVINSINEYAIMVEPEVTVSIIDAKKTDNRILECAVAGKVDCLVSGDKKHILPLKEFHEIKIMSPAEFLDYFYTKKKEWLEKK